MKRKVSMLLAGILLIGAASAASAQSAEVLLEKGVFLEEMKGDRDGAMKIYQRIVDETKATRRCVAEALYRLGMGHLAKGDKEKAADALGRLVQEYGEQKKFADRARAALAKLAPPAAPHVVLFGPVIQAVLNSPDVTRENSFLDLDTGNLFTLPEGLNRKPEDTSAWMEQNHIDFGVGDLSRHLGKINKVRFFGIGAVLLPMKNELWDTLTPSDVDAKRLGIQVKVAGPRMDHLQVERFRGEQPYTCIFKTREGGAGLLQIIGFNAQQSGIRIRYKLLARPAALPPATQPAVVFGPVVERVINDIDEADRHQMIDFETGKHFSLPADFAGWTRRRRERWMAEEGRDALVDDAPEGCVVGGYDFVAASMGAVKWEAIRPQDVRAALRTGKAGVKTITRGRATSYFVQRGTVLAFRTRDGGTGVLQIVGFMDKPKGVKIRYRMLARAPANPFASRWDPTFRTVLEANTVADLDAGRKMGLKKDSAIAWADAFDLAWGSEMGGVLMTRRGSAVRLLALPTARDFADAGRQAIERFDELGRSAERALVARRSRYGAVLTDRGRLAVVHVSKFEPAKGTLNWSLARAAKTNGRLVVTPVRILRPAEQLGEGIFEGQTVERTLADKNVKGAKNVCIDFETGRTFPLPAGSKATLDSWLVNTGVDAVAEVAEGESGLTAVGGRAMALRPDEQTKLTAAQARKLLDEARPAPTNVPTTLPSKAPYPAKLWKQLQARGADRRRFLLPVKRLHGPMPILYASASPMLVETREGSLVLLEIPSIDPRKRELTARYTLLARRAAIPPGTQPTAGEAGTRPPAPSETD